MRSWTPEQRETQRQKLRDYHARKRGGTAAGGRIVLTRPGRTAKASPLTLRDLPRVLEAYALVERLGWERARQLAKMFDE